MANQDVRNVKLIAQRLEFVDDVRSFSCVCKSWRAAVFELEPGLFSKYPCLLLAEDVGKDLSAVKISKLEAIFDEMDDPIDFSKCSKADDLIRGIDNLFINRSSIRGWFSLASQKLYKLDLPEATDRLLFGTNNGWLLTLGRDFETNLLNPLSRHQIQLPPMPILPCQNKYKYDDYQDLHIKFISKVAVSSELPTKTALQPQSGSRRPIIMVSYTEYGILGFTRLGDKFWTNVNVESPEVEIAFQDIVYHKEKFYAINFAGKVFMCDVDYIDKKERLPKGKMITSVHIERKDCNQSYLIESLSGSHMWLVLRSREGELFKEDSAYTYGELCYYTVNFKVFKLEVNYSNSNDVIPTCTRIQEVKYLGNEALFIGNTSSKVVASSEFIKANSIYFTDDSQQMCYVSGGHDMGIFNLETRKIMPHFQGISIHPFSPSLWYI